MQQNGLDYLQQALQKRAVLLCQFGGTGNLHRAIHGGNPPEELRTHAHLNRGDTCSIFLGYKASVLAKTVGHNVHARLVANKLRRNQLAVKAPEELAIAYLVFVLRDFLAAARLFLAQRHIAHAVNAVLAHGPMLL